MRVVVVEAAAGYGKTVLGAELVLAAAAEYYQRSGQLTAAADRCDGTFTHDVTDSVAVTDFVTHKTIILHAGQSYLARP